MSDEVGWLTAVEALERLHVRPQTLYSYVSRGRVLAKPRADDPRRSLYSQPDVERMAASSRAVRRPSAIASSTIAWGEPVLSSAISTVHAGRLLYRGVDVIELSAVSTFEEVAGLLWQVPKNPFARVSSPPPTRTSDDAESRALVSLAQLAASGVTALGRPVSELIAEAASIVCALAVAVGGARWRPGEPMHEYLAQSWNAHESGDAIRRALVLLADHELNVSTFAARVTGSSGAPLAACVLSGLCALSGPRHGRMGLDVAKLVRGFGNGQNPFAPSGAPPGFGHPLYAGTDIRASALLSCFEEPEDHALARLAVAESRDLAPNIDYALSAMTARFGLPAKAPLLIFAAARSVGWLAHVFEQIEQGDLIRPRATYTGSLPA